MRHLALRAMCCALATMLGSPLATVRADQAQPVVVDVSPAHVLNRFSPLRTVGAGVDSQTFGAVANIYTPKNVTAMLSAGLGPASYRLYTELSVQDWHWNPHGTWSDPAGQGYWTGAATASRAIVDTFGYRLPHRGFTNDQGNNDDYSRLDDGDRGSYWKSNPYLTSRFTDEPDAMHPQWAVVALAAPAPLNAIRIDWSHPYASAYLVQYWNGPDAIADPGNGQWVTFPGGTVRDADGGTTILRLARSPLSAQFVRILMQVSSQTCDSHGNRDVRNCVGYAIAELGLGTIDAHGGFHDLIHHAASISQTTTYVSSVDPWHAPADRVLDQEQPGLDIFYRSGVTRGLPALMAVGMLYSTPDDAAAQIRYLESQHDAISGVELGEEPDGQYILPEDYGALYLQWARALHRVDPRLRLGGPVFQGVTQDVQTWPDASGDVSWLHRFLRYVRSHGRLSDLAFMSFEHYPFDACDRAVAQDLYDEPRVLRNILQTWYADGLPRIPIFITETNFSASSSSIMQDIAGGLWLADFEASFLSLGGSGSYLYQYEPEPLVSSSSNCTTFGAWGMFAADGNNQIRQPAAQYFAARMLMRHWLEPIDAVHTLSPASVDVVDQRGNRLVTAYAVLRPDGTWAVLLINKDPARTHRVTVAFKDGSSRRERHFQGLVSAVTFGDAQYRWHSNGPDGFANPDGPEVSRGVGGGKGAIYVLPCSSITVLSGSVP